MVNAVLDDSPIRNMVLLLGRFHTLMNLLGVIGTFMGGSGLHEILDTVYGVNAIVHMMTGNAMQLSFREQPLVEQCVICQIVVKITEDHPGFQDQVKELENIYMLMETGGNDVRHCCG